MVDKKKGKRLERFGQCYVVYVGSFGIAIQNSIPKFVRFFSWNERFWEYQSFKRVFLLGIIFVILYGYEVWGCSVFKHGWRKIKMIQMHFVTYNLKIKRYISYFILGSKLVFPHLHLKLGWHKDAQS